VIVDDAGCSGGYEFKMFDGMLRRNREDGDGLMDGVAPLFRERTHAEEEVIRERGRCSWSRCDGLLLAVRSELENSHAAVHGL
jgi:hypothetical protein